MKDVYNIFWCIQYFWGWLLCHRYLRWLTKLWGSQSCWVCNFLWNENPQSMLIFPCSKCWLGKAVFKILQAERHTKLECVVLVWVSYIKSLLVTQSLFFTDAIFSNLPSFWNLFVAPKSIFIFLLQLFIGLAQWWKILVT